MKIKTCSKITSIFIIISIFIAWSMRNISFAVNQNDLNNKEKQI